RADLVGQGPVGDFAGMLVEGAVVVDLRLLGGRLPVLLGLLPRAGLGGLGLGGLAASADRGDVPGRAGGGQEGRDQDPRDRAGWRAPAARLHGHSLLQPYTRQFSGAVFRRSLTSALARSRRRSASPSSITRSRSITASAFSHCLRS